MLGRSPPSDFHEQFGICSVYVNKTDVLADRIGSRSAMNYDRLTDKSDLKSREICIIQDLKAAI